LWPSKARNLFAIPHPLSLIQTPAHPRNIVFFIKIEDMTLKILMSRQKKLKG